MRPIGVTELHVHLEGSLSIESAIEIASVRNHPWGAMTRRDLRFRFRYSSLNDFLGAVRDMCEVLNSPGALERAARELSLFLRRSGVRYAEVYASPYIFARWGQEFGAVFGAIDRGFAAGETAGGAQCAVLLDTVRQWGPEAAMFVLDAYEESRIARVVGFGLGGQESGPLEVFLPAYERARSLGLRTMVHAGEEAGVDDVWKAIEVLGVDRIAHGIRSVDDPKLLTELRERRVPLDLAITSNYKTGAVKGEHPVRRLLDAGVTVTINTDDPSLFRTTLPREFARARRFGGITDDEAWTIAENGIACSFADDETKRALDAELSERKREARRLSS
ncbi:MAG: adenosine deaminase [Thermoanaerobaculia bacterium]